MNKFVDTKQALFKEIVQTFDGVLLDTSQSDIAATAFVDLVKWANIDPNAPYLCVSLRFVAAAGILNTRHAALTALCAVNATWRFSLYINKTSQKYKDRKSI